ncbi:hypothetical protein P8859_15110 [Bacillus spizizenii]|nr:hypothetical protein [Bacillus spizizenii]MCY8313186.1 hypothetical protein [Bacillus spizizenii]MCY8417326.1 hypothetical protein [Bacillus spizizenii]MCY9333474.1 hypothetical protein [Bacillus spizizenii]MEC0620619.1 hypothetical protein [Bacillus spizizenii]
MSRKLRVGKQNDAHLNKHPSSWERALKLGKQAIDELVLEAKPVTLRNVSMKSKEIDPGGKGIHFRTVQTNEELNNYYKKNSDSYRKRKILRETKKPPIKVHETDYLRIKPERDIKAVEKRYMSKNKRELVKRLIQAEQYIVRNEERWFGNHFENYEEEIKKSQNHSPE